jgi:hypothetical protein
VEVRPRTVLLALVFIRLRHCLCSPNADR